MPPLILEGVRLLVVDDDQDFLDGVAGLAELEGARVARATNVSDALRAASTAEFDVLVVDLTLGAEDGADFVARARTLGCAAPAIAVTAHSAALIATRRASAGFAKWLQKPFEITDLLIAISSLAAPLDARDELRAVLARENGRTPYRFTSLFRFDDEALTSVWSFDRESPLADECPVEMKVQDSYCCVVRKEEDAFAVGDAWTDIRVAGHPKQMDLRSYCGVPVRDARGVVIGSLCHFDTAAREVDSASVARLAALAHDLEGGLLARLSVRAGTRLG